MGHEITPEMAMHEAVKATYPNIGKKFQREQSACEALWGALVGGSKTLGSKDGQGIPEAAIFRDTGASEPVALIECKKALKIEKAREEAQGYVRHVASKGLRVPLAIGFDGSSLTVDFHDAAKNLFIPCKKENGECFEQSFKAAGRWPTEEELLSLASSSDGRLRPPTPPLSDAVQSEFFRRTNETMRAKGVETQDRIIVFTAFLVACREHGFRQQVSSPPPKKDANKLGRDVLASIESLMDSVENEDVGQDLKGFVDFAKPKLVAEKQAKEKAKNGAEALQKVIREDIPAIAAKNGLGVGPFIDGLNESLFKIVDVYDVFQTYAASNDLGQYFTPRQTVRAMIRLSELLRGRPLGLDDIVYDPACGVGGFLVGALERVAEAFWGAERERAKKTFGRQLLGCENTLSVAHVARVNLWMHGDGTSGISGKSSLERDWLNPKPEIGEHGIQNGIPAPHPVMSAIKALSEERDGADARPTLVLMNPPFPHDKKDFQSFEFVEHALATLREGGLLCALVPATTVISEDKLHSGEKGKKGNIDGFRSRVLKHAQLLAVVSLPVDLFAPGASVNTYVIVLKKQDSGHQLNQSVLFARCPTDGFEMSKSVKRRMGPKTQTEKASRRWDENLMLGEHWADLLIDRGQSEDGTFSAPSWVRQHSELGGIDIMRHAVSKPLTKADKDDGRDWAPERFINDKVSAAEILRLANRISAEMQAFEVMKGVGGKW